MAIFISYGHSEKIDPFIDSLTNLLISEKVDNVVWTDKKIRLGQHWVEEIDRNIANCDIFLFIQTKEAMRDGSYCFGEIALAGSFNPPKKMIIFKVDNTMDSSLFIGYQKLMMTDLLDEKYSINHSALSKYVPLIVDTLKILINEEKQKADLDPSRILPSINFIKSLHPHCVDINPEYMELVQQLANSHKNFLCFTGMPGSGKSYIISELYRLIPQSEKTIHFFQHNNSNSCTINSLMYSIAACLAQHDNEYREYLKTKRKNLFLDVLNKDQLFELLFKSRSFSINTDIVYVLIDGVDELSESTINELILLLTDFTKLNFPRFKFIIATRYIPSFINRILGLGCILKEKIETDNYREMLSYIETKYPHLGLNSNDINYIINMSHGDYIYLKFICEEISDKSGNDIRELTFPQSMHGIINMYLDRIFETKEIEYSDMVKDFLSVLCGAAEPLTITQLSRILQTSESEISRIIKILDQFLVVDSLVVKIGHKSLYDCLAAMVPGEKYYVSIQNGKRIIAEWCAENFIKKEVDIYTYKHGIKCIYENLNYEKFLDMFYIDDGRVSDATSRFVIMQIIDYEDKTYDRILNSIINDQRQYPRSLFKILKSTIELKRLPDSLQPLPNPQYDKRIIMLNDYISFFRKRCASVNSFELIESGENLLKYDFDIKSRADVLKYVADAYRHLGNHEKAISLYNKAKNLCSFDKRSTTYLDNYCALLDLDYVSGNINEVLKKIAEIRKDICSDDISLSNYKLLKLEGEIYKFVDKKKALKLFEKSKEIALKMSAVIQLYDANNNISEVSEDLELALSLLHRNVELYEKYEYNKLYYGKTCSILSSTYFQQEDYVKSYEWAVRSMNVMRSINYGSGLANAQVKCALASYKLNQSDKAKELLIEAIRFYEREHVYPVLHMQALNSLYDICDKKDFSDDIITLFSVDCINYKENFVYEYEIIHKIAQSLGYYKLKEHVSSFLQQAGQPFCGYYNNNYRFHNDLNGKDYIVRVKKDCANQMDFRAFDEILLLSILDLPIAPKPYMKFIINNKQTSLLNFMEGETLSKLYPCTADIPDDIIKQIAFMMNKIHSHDISAIKGINTLKEIIDIKSYINFYNEFIIKKYNEYLPVYGNVFSILKFPKDTSKIVNINYDVLEYEQLSLCHGDVHQNNIILNEKGEISLIDWELSMLAPKSADIAIHFHRMKYSESQKLTFLNYYIEIDPTFAFYINNMKEILKLEEIKTVIVDIVRYLNIMIKNELSEIQKNNLIRNYACKLQKAYNIWKVDSDENETLNRVAALFKNTSNTGRIL